MIMTIIHPGTAHILAIYSTSFYGNAKMYMQSAVCVLTTSMLSTHLTYLLELGKQNLAGAPGAAIRV